MNTPNRRSPHRGFTLIELLVVLGIIALLMTLAVPRYFHSIDSGKETILQNNLKSVRETIDKYYADNGAYPDSLQELVDSKYLRELPYDPITDSRTSWTVEAPQPPIKGNVVDLHSSAPGKSKNGSTYASF